MPNSFEYTEFQGCRGLVYAEVLTDDNETAGGGYTTGPVKPLAGLANVSKTFESSSESHYYDNKPVIVVSSEGADTLTFECSVIRDEALADISGRVYDQTKKAIIEAPRKVRYFAVGYILGEVGGKAESERYVWRYKGTFSQPDETSQTKDSSTTANGMTLTFTGVFTTHEFTNGGGSGVKSPAKAMMVRAGGTITEEAFFKAVYTPDSTGA